MKHNPEKLAGIVTTEMRLLLRPGICLQDISYSPRIYFQKLNLYAYEENITK